MYREIIKSQYGNEPDNFHVTRADDELHVTLTYPPWTDADNKGQVRYVVFDQESVRATDGIRVSFDFDRDGYKIEQASRFGFACDDEVCDPDWQEVAFVQAWGREESEAEMNLRCFGPEP
jgi:hypothetical protein